MLTSCANVPAGHPKKPDPAADAERLEKMCGAMRTILECIGEDPDRPGLLDSPSRYAKALLFLTKGYQQTPREIINNAIWDDEGHNHHGMVIVRDIEVFSLCEHHLVPFTGKVRTPCYIFQLNHFRARTFIPPLPPPFLDGRSPPLTKGKSNRSTSATSPPRASWASPSWRA